MRFSQKYSLLKLCLLLSLISLAKTITLDESGYYNLVVAIDDQTAQNTISEYVENIKAVIQDMSDLLYQTTGGKFSIKNTNILIPIHWNVPNSLAATSEYFDGADIKISHRYAQPYVYNPTSCGQAGENILLPYNFFNENTTGEFGRSGKALLTQFVRLRYGAWEEHGYPGDPRFPYFWKKANGEDWEVNSCTDMPVAGTYQDINDGTECGTDPDDVDNLYPPNSTCRFFPNENQGSTGPRSSLMTYHHLKIVDEFCTSETHNKETPSPHNFFCKYKSVMEVIESSPDWKLVTTENKADRVAFKVVKNAGSPLFYVLLDGGKSQAPMSILTGISSSLKSLVGDADLRNIIAGVGVFPGPSATKHYSTLAPWSHLRTDSSKVIDALDTGFGSSVGFRNYPAALKTILDEINSMKPSQGAAILIVKTGEELNPGLTPENEVIGSILSSNINLFAIEIQGNTLQPRLALQKVVETSDGKHLTIATQSDIQAPLREFMENLKKTLKSKIQLYYDYKLVLNKVVPLGEEISLPISGYIDWRCYIVVLSGEVSGRPVFVKGSGTAMWDVEMEEKNDWGQSEQISKKTFYSENGFPSDAQSWESFKYDCVQEPCQLLVMLFEAFERSEDSVEEDIQINLSVSTSAVNEIVDMAVANAATLLGVPFAIYARLDEDGTPLKSDDNFKVTATIYLSDYSRAWTLDLVDDGTSIPDVSTNDGVFSGTFVPSVDGIHKIRVTASYKIQPEVTTTTTEQPRLKKSKRSTRAEERLLPLDQMSIGCGSEFRGCWSKSPENEFEIVRELSGVVEFKNVDNYQRYVWRITDLELVPIEDYTVFLRWSDPGVHLPMGSSQYNQTDAYYIVQHEDFNMVLNNYLDCEVVDTKYLQPNWPGSKREWEVRLGRAGIRYFAIRTILGGQSEEQYNDVVPIVLGVNITELNVTTTTTTTTTTLRPTASSTTTLPTVITESTTVDEQTSTVANTRTTTLRTTTPRITQTSTTTIRTTTRPPVVSTEKPVKFWFQETEGIITLSVFGGLLALLMAGGIMYVWMTRYR